VSFSVHIFVSRGETPMGLQCCLFAVISMRSMIGQDDLISLADVLMSIVNGPFKVSGFG
jgi:hypothetical protein